MVSRNFIHNKTKEYLKMKKIIKNDIVTMDWDADLFFESRKRGFIAAVNVYETSKGSVPVIFQDNKIFLLIDPDTVKPASVEDISGAIKDCFKENLDIEDAFEDSYVELGIGSVDEEDIANNYGLSDEDIADINKRLRDLSAYWEVVEEAMF